MNAINDSEQALSGFRNGSAYGELAEALAGCLPGEAVLRYEEGEVADLGHALEWMPRWTLPPKVRWEASGSTGDFDLSDFMTIATGGEPESAFTIEVAAHTGLPFVALHPSGQLQAVRYDEYEGSFKRRILYATASEPCAMQMATQGADIS